MNELVITDLTQLRFKKVNHYKVQFSYENKEYILLSEEDDDCALMLMERIKVRENRYILNYIKSVISCKKPEDFIKDISKTKPHHLVYSNINREWFAKQMAKTGLADEEIEVTMYHTGAQ